MRGAPELDQNHALSTSSLQALPSTSGGGTCERTDRGVTKDSSHLDADGWAGDSWTVVAAPSIQGCRSVLAPWPGELRWGGGGSMASSFSLLFLARLGAFFQLLRFCRSHAVLASSGWPSFGPTFYRSLSFHSFVFHLLKRERTGKTDE